MIFPASAKGGGVKLGGDSNEEREISDAYVMLESMVRYIPANALTQNIGIIVNYVPVPHTDMEVSML